MSRLKLVSFIDDLTLFISPECEIASRHLKNTWHLHWKKIYSDKNTTDTLVYKIAGARNTTRDVLNDLY